MNITTVTVIGANGTMGANVSGVFALNGGCKVYMVARSLEKAQAGVEKTIKGARTEEIRDRLIPRDYSSLEECVGESQFVFESVAEDIAIKEDITTRIAKCRKPGTIVGTGTSGLSIASLEKCFDQEGREHYLGCHFFNPPLVLPLVELIPSADMKTETVDEIEAYLSNVLKSKPCRMKEGPGFIGNRVGFMLMNEAIQLAEKYADRGGIDYIDRVMGKYTGRNMEPIVTADFVGLDVHKAIVDNCYDKLPDDFARKAFVLPAYVQKLIDEGKLGRKAGAGLYKSFKDADGNRVSLVYDIPTGEFRPVAKYVFPYVADMIAAYGEGDYAKAMDILFADKSEEAKICRYMLIKYVLYSVYVGNAISFGGKATDICMAYGFGWVPPTGLLRAIGVERALNEIKANDLFVEGLGGLDAAKLLNESDLSGEIPFEKYMVPKP